MLRKNDPSEGLQWNLFTPRIEEEIDPHHPLVILADEIPWPSIEKQFQHGYARRGRPGKSIRMMVGFHFLQRLFDLSEERLVSQWCQEPSWQYLCGMAFFDTTPPLERSALPHWRKRFGQETLEMAIMRIIQAGEACSILHYQDQKLSLLDDEGSAVP
ncbi:transposase [Magnetococcus sp. PR-3]|uniref:transposase n=1 Tax=Magnetococcus sp. PR-3 TaxID=3120355 RepID=UPI002FCE1E37